MKKRIAGPFISPIWGLIMLAMVLLGSCGLPPQPSPPPLLTAGPTGPETSTRSPTSTTSPTATPKPSAKAQAEIVLLVVDCTWKFCPPEELEQQVLLVIGKPGIFTAAALDELHVRVIYDPTQLTPQEAIDLFARTTRLEVEQKE